MNVDYSSYPYPSRRMPVFARNVVATSQPLAAQAGLEMLRAGGNAIDAAVATAAALTVVEPSVNGIGSDNFALIWAGGGLHGMNASGRAPIAFDISRFDGLDRIPFQGWGGVTTPGAVSGWVLAHEQFGTLPFERVLEPSIRYAREGFIVSPETGSGWKRAQRSYREFRAWQETFAPGGRAPRIGEVFRSNGHADTLQKIAETKGEAFYRGDVARQIADASATGGGMLGLEDLERHEADWVRPISVDYHGYRLHEIPPNGQGLTALLALGMLRHLDVHDEAPDSVMSLHLQIECMKLAFRDAHRYIADPDFMDVRVEDLLDDGYLESRARLVKRDRATDFDHGTPKSGGTVLLTASDSDGNMVSLIQSNYTGFGSGVVVPGTGIALQNRGCCFSLEKGHPNVAAPGKRPYHTIIPGFLTRQDESGAEHPVMAFGVMGGFMQPQGHAQVAVRMVDYEQNPQAALDAPRWQVFEGLDVSIEPGFETSLYDGLEDMGHAVRRERSMNAGFGRGQVNLLLEDGYAAASDPRADGQAVGF